VRLDGSFMGRGIPLVGLDGSFMGWDGSFLGWGGSLVGYFFRTGFICGMAHFYDRWLIGGIKWLIFEMGRLISGIRWLIFGIEWLFGGIGWHNFGME
jgi:hypothetical protein